jgi:hypothetical protein
MYFDFDDRYRDIEPVGSAINRRDGVACVVMSRVSCSLLLFAPQYSSNTCRRRGASRRSSSRAEDAAAFVFVQPKAICRRCASRIASRCRIVDRSARSPEKTPTWTTRCRRRAVIPRSGRERHPKRRCAARARRRSPRPRRRPSKRPPSSISGQAPTWR